uniref:Uncharacterized protein n=1 Tax=Podarcis muralis TaxID=64176 RepID=A0A670KPB9_PODMU
PCVPILLPPPVERYNPLEDRWTPCPPLKTCRENLGCVTFQGNIYVVGGRDDLTELCSVERFDPLANEWSVVTPMKSRRSKVSVLWELITVTSKLLSTPSQLVGETL